VDISKIKGDPSSMPDFRTQRLVWFVPVLSIAPPIGFGKFYWSAQVRREGLMRFDSLRGMSCHHTNIASSIRRRASPRNF